VGTWGTAGTSAKEGYRAAVSRRRRLGGLKWAALLGAPAAAWMAFGWFHGHALIVFEGCLAGVFLVAAALPADKDPGRWFRGARGEVATGLVLDTLPGRRWHVFHDLAIPGSNANIDHLAVGPSGVWVIDSKTTRTAPRIGIRSVRLGERRLGIDSVRWQAQVVSDRLEVKARPVVALHVAGESGEFWLPRRGVRRRGVRVVLASDLARRLKRGRRRLRRGDIDEMSRAVVEHFRFAGAGARQNGRQ